jgi:MoaA/NifB/PqqE/SkfB family radical SAM enzyme
MARWDYNQRETLRRTQFWVSGVCNNDCVFCLDDLWKPGCPARIEGALPRPDLVIGPDRLEAFLSGRDLANEVCITGPDPGTCRELVAIVTKVRELGFSRVAVVTNGRGLARAGVAADLVEAGVTRFELSIHGGRPEVHDAATRRPGSFAQALAGLRAALGVRNRGGRLQVEIVTVVYRGNLEALDESVAVLLATGPDRLSVNVVEPRGEALTRFDEIVPPLAASAAALTRLLRRFGGVARLTVDGVPPCLLPGLEGFAGNREAVDLAAGSGELFDAEVRDEGRAFGDGCHACLHRPVCTGVYRTQAERHGLALLRPVRLRGGESTSETERRGLLALFYDRFERRYREQRLAREHANVARLSTLLPAGRRVTLQGSDPLGARVSLDGVPCRLRLTPDAEVPATLRAGPFVLVPDEPSSDLASVGDAGVIAVGGGGASLGEADGDA